MVKVSLSHAIQLQESEKAYLYRFYANVGIAELWVPKSVKNSKNFEQWAISKIDRIQRSPKANIKERSENAVYIEFGNCYHWVPNSVFEMEFFITPKVNKWLLENKYIKIEKILVETEKAINIEGAWVSKRFVVSDDLYDYVPKWCLERKREEL